MVKRTSLAAICCKHVAAGLTYIKLEGGSGRARDRLGVSDLIELKPEQVRPAPDFSSSFDTRYITGLGKVDQRMLILVKNESD
jgi:hypothetical protein